MTATSNATSPQHTVAPLAERLRHVNAAERSGMLTAPEAAHLRDCIRHAGMEYDVYERDGQRGAWVVWTHGGERPLVWWRERCAEAAHRDRGRR